MKSGCVLIFTRTLRVAKNVKVKKFARQLVVTTVVISMKSCVSPFGQHLLEYVGDMSGRFDALFRGRQQVMGAACVPEGKM